MQFVTYGQRIYDVCVSHHEGEFELENCDSPHLPYANLEESSDAYYTSSDTGMTNEYSQMSLSDDDEISYHSALIVSDYQSSDEEDTEGAELLMYFYHNAPQRLGSLESEESDINEWNHGASYEETSEYSGLCDGDHTPTGQATDLYFTP